GSVPPAQPTAEGPPARRPEVFGGLGTWLDIYDPSWSHPVRTAREAAARGVRTLYLQTSNFHRGRAIVFPEAAGAILEAAHAEGIAVVAWYLPGFRDLRLDLHRVRRALAFRSPAGERFDAFALDIESPEVRDPAVRTARLLRLSAAIRRAVGGGFPLGAIVPSPRGMMRNPSYWPGFPFPALARLYDAFLPMTYFTWRVEGRDRARAYTSWNIRLIRSAVGEPAVPIHVIGGIADQATLAETRGFVEAVREQGAAGASYYTFPLTGPGHWRALGRLAPPAG
ncbi:MAG TPA: hypothetical protein VNO17_02515, partial [Actinomycetota bacterium]|nr:hypothetical protein [Actinomycetota bacterium]